jgi:hypothetical protein
LQESCAASSISQPRGDVRQNPSRALYAVQAAHVEARLGYLGAQFLRLMEIGRREVIETLCRIAVLTLAEVALDDTRETLVSIEIARKSVERGGETRDSRGDEHAAWAQDSSGLAKRSRSICGVDEVVQGTEQKHERYGLVGGRKRPCIGNAARSQFARGGV